jgi:hypothetical protein
LLLGACGVSDPEPTAGADPVAATAASTAPAAVGTTVPPTTLPTAPPPVPTAGAVAAPPTTPPPISTADVPTPPTALPMTPQEPVALAAEIEAVERAIRDPATSAAELPDLGHRQQLAYRTLSRNPQWDQAVLAALPEDLRVAASLNVAAPREALGMFGKVGTKLPAWEIVAPVPADTLLGYYTAAEAETGVDWEVLAAINLVETGMGRIRGLSSAGAQGPMQFMPATWAQWGQGDVTDPADAIPAAARYLRDRGAPADYTKAIWAYNNHNNYVRAVTAYADVMRADARAFHGYYHWQIHHYSDAGDLWLREGYAQPEPVIAVEWAAANPAMVAGPVPPTELIGRGG